MTKEFSTDEYLLYLEKLEEQIEKQHEIMSCKNCPWAIYDDHIEEGYLFCPKNEWCVDEDKYAPECFCE